MTAVDEGYDDADGAGDEDDAVYEEDVGSRSSVAAPASTAPAPSSELDAMKSKLAEIEEEARKLEAMQEAVDGLAASAGDKEEVDERSVFVGNVDFGAKPAELQQHFDACGAILRVTILCDKWTGQPKGFAYVEFMEKEAVARAVELNESIFRGRPLKVVAKRTNVPGMARRRRRTAFRPRGGFGGFPRRRPRRGYNPYY